MRGLRNTKFVTTDIAMAVVTPLTVSQLSAQDVQQVFSPAHDFQALIKAATGLSGNAGHLSPAEAAASVLDACAVCGHASFAADYVHEVCGNKAISSTSVDHIPLLDGGLVQQWMQQSIKDIESELRTVCASGNGMSDETGLSRMRTRLLSYQTINAALKSAGLHGKTVPAGVALVSLVLGRTRVYIRPTFVCDRKVRHFTVNITCSITIQQASQSAKAGL